LEKRADHAGRDVLDLEIPRIVLDFVAERPKPFAQFVIIEVLRDF